MSVPCAVGRGGLTKRKREGDGATPVGAWLLREIFYRADRVRAPVSSLKCSVIEQYDGWCDDPESPLYNKPVRLPFRYSHEKMWRDDHIYDIVVTLGYNDRPVVRNAGSAIFFHLAHDDFQPTEGCVAVSLQDMRKILPLCGPGTIMEIGS
ncbi:MAG: L,D-transpeptidase family protein [Hyphomicrobiales bacterium]